MKKNQSFLYSLFICFFSLFYQISSAQPTVRQFVGVNLNAEDSWEKAKRFAHVREFHLWADDISTNPDNNNPCPFEAGNTQKLRWNPSYNTNLYIDYDQFYQALPKKVSAVMHGAAPSMYGGGFTGEVYGKPICRNSVGGNSFFDPAYHKNPVAYKQQTIWQSLFAARYGAAPSGGFPGNFTNIAANYIVNPDNTGLGKGLVRYMENFNEHDAAWFGADNVNISTTNPQSWVPAGQLTTWFFKPEEYAAMLSANYDGHCKNAAFLIPGTTDSYWGIKNLSSDVSVVMSATADLRQNYINLVINEFSNPNSMAYRPCGDLPFDVLNMHHYPTEQHPAEGTPEYNYIMNGVRFFGAGRGTFPEDANEQLKQRIRNTLNASPGLSMSGRKLWITELGYDSHDAGAQSNVETHEIGPFDRQTVQGQWLTRCVFEMLASTPDLTRVDLYRMQDEPGTGQFTHTGILDIDAKPKKSWYHVMTQINVLGDYIYVETPNNGSRTKFFLSNNPSAPGAPEQYDVPRLYKFIAGGDNTRPAFALWEPTGNNVTQFGMFFIPDLQVTKALKIEVQDFDENGKRTLIPDADIVYVPGQGTYIKNLKLSETPLYIKINGVKDFSDPVANPVQNLQVSSICCDAARLTWDMPTPNVSGGTVIGTSFQVYYAPVSNFGSNPPSFDLSKLITVEEKLPGTFRECIITGLSPNVQYFFFVIPVRDVIFNQSLIQGLIPILPAAGDLIDHQHYVKGMISGCGAGTNDCLLSIENEGTISAPAGWETMVNQTFGVGKTSAEKCAELATQPTGGINMPDNGPFTLTFSVSFFDPKFLRAIYFNHGTGGPGKIRIEIMEDCCNLWKLVKELDINGYNNWFVLANKHLNYRRVEKIRFTIIRNRAQNLLLPRIYICGGPAPNICPGGMAGYPSSLTNPSELTAKDIDNNSAWLSWTPGGETTTDGQYFPATRYRIRYGSAVDGQENIVAPKELFVNADGAESSLDTPLSELAPGTLYFVDLDIDPLTLECAAIPNTQARTIRTTFTTQSAPNPRNDARALPAIESILIMPNPAFDRMQVIFSAQGYTQWTISRIDGAVLRSGKWSGDQTGLSIDVSDMAAGLYVIHFIGGEKQPVGKSFVIQR